MSDNKEMRLSEEQKNPLMLRKKAVKLSEAFKKILAKPEPVQTSRDVDDESRVSSLQQLKQREERRKRAFYEVPKAGEDPDHDQREKKLIRLATKGVVQMFNQMARIQKQKQIDEKKALPVGAADNDGDEESQTSEDTSSTAADQWEVLKSSFSERIDQPTSESEEDEFPSDSSEQL